MVDVTTNGKSSVVSDNPTDKGKYYGENLVIVLVRESEDGRGANLPLAALLVHQA